MLENNRKEEILKRLETFKKVKDGHWLFTGSTNRRAGYGRLMIDGKQYLVHILSAWIYKDFDLKSEDLILHIRECKFKHCWNPEHVYVGNYSDNIADSIANGAHYDYNKYKTHCPRNHPYEGRNLVIKCGKRCCRECIKISNAKRRKN